jgi:alginate O-acetyltransferase complex protein AlgI
MNRIYDIFRFTEDSPLIFTQANFWIFFVCIYVVFALIYKKIALRNIYLLLISLLFYYKTSGAFVGILLFSTCVDYAIGGLIFKQTKKNIRLALVTTSVIINLTVLCYFKYAYFFTDSFNYLFHTDYQVINWLAQWSNTYSQQNYFTVDKIILPVGISFYTFQTISYSVDIYRGKLKPLKSILDFGFFVSFFPQLVAGPIVRAEHFVPQISKVRAVTAQHFNVGTILILKGLVKKMIFADYIARQFLDRVFDAPEMHSGFENVMAMIGYSLQIYGDFSGYTDIAIGLALLMGFTLPKNFNSPYKAINAADFWKRWHISLSTWLKDYLYIPLGGNKRGTIASYIILSIILIGVIIAYKNLVVLITITSIVLFIFILSQYLTSFKNYINTNINLLLTMLIGGLWHGASWKFVIWGGLNGMGIVVYKLWRKISPYEQKKAWYFDWWKILVTFIFITFTRIYFRGESMDHISRWYYQVMNNMDLQNAWSVIVHYKLVFIVMVLGYLAHWLPENTKERIEQFYFKSPAYLKIAYAVIVSVVCYQSYSSDFQAFIYFQF